MKTLTCNYCSKPAEGLWTDEHMTGACLACYRLKRPVERFSLPEIDKDPRQDWTPNDHRAANFHAGILTDDRR